MEFLGLVVLVVLVIWWGNSRAREARRRDAGTFSYDIPGGYSSYVVNFTTRRLHYFWNPPNPDPMDRDGNREYELRRDGGGSWNVRMTNDSWARALQQARAALKSIIPVARERAEQELAALGDAPAWEPVDSELGPLIESRYQSYLDAFGLKA